MSSAPPCLRRGCRPSAQTPSAPDLLARVDANEVYASISYTGQDGHRVPGQALREDLHGLAPGRSSTASSNSPTPRTGARSTSRRTAACYVYSPDTEEVMLISGHLLKESMMGSDLSYEDTIDNEKLSARYVAVLSGREDPSEGRDAWVLDLTARRRKPRATPGRSSGWTSETGDLLRFGALRPLGSQAQGIHA
ncbi:MAG: outer membrane lipoprotein-sorting protein [Desulfomicrobium escambiense]|nr:outer membrane lipoprotein-sorting protein [Desulfomicrobium escambiense]